MYTYVCACLCVCVYVCVCMYVCKISTSNHCHVFLYLFPEGRCSNPLYARSRSTRLAQPQGWTSRNTSGPQWGTPWQPALSATVSFLYIICLNGRWIDCWRGNLVAVTGLLKTAHVLMEKLLPAGYWRHVRNINFNNLHHFAWLQHLFAADTN